MRRMGYVPLAAAAVFVVGAACTSNDSNRAANDRDRDQTAMASPSPNAGTYGTSTVSNDRKDQPDAGDIVGNPAKYDGQHVVLKVDVNKVMPNGFFEVDKDLLVLSPSGQPREKENVTISGTVQSYSAPQLKSKYNWFKSDRTVDEKYKDRAVVVVDSIVTADGREIVNANTLPASSGAAGDSSGFGAHKGGNRR